MKRVQPLALTVILLCCSNFLYAQAWSGILQSSSTCNPTATNSPGQCAIDWSTAGIPGGIPSGTWTQSGGTIQASAYGNGSTDATSAIQSALNSCGTNNFVLLSAGTFLINGNLSIPGSCALRGQGANQTILNSMATSGPPISLGTGSAGSGWPWTNSVSIISGASVGSSLIVLSSASGVNVGGYLVISQLNDGVTVSQGGSEGQCTWCDGGETSTGGRAQGQIVEVETVSGNTIGISPPLYVSYTLTPHATAFTATKYAGVENLQVYANNTHTSGTYSNFVMSACAYCWLSGVEGNYTDGDHVDVYWGYRDEIVNSYFSNAFLHVAGQYDSDVDLIDKTSGTLVQNNILERLHVAIMLEWGAAGNVISYNYSLGNFDSSTPNFMIGSLGMHGTHPQFNLYEGNVIMNYGGDSIWGSAANNTAFRNWTLGTSKACNPTTGRGTVTCTPVGANGSAGVNGWWEFQAARAVDFQFLATNWNSVGNVVGSSAMQSLQAYSSAQPSVAQAVAVCGPSPCGPGSRQYDADNFGYTFGYGLTSDTGTGTAAGNGCSGSYTYACNSANSYNTAFIHGDYSNISGKAAWVSNVTQTLPASFYLTSQPSWWPSTIAWPSVGPDVTGGSGPGGHVASTTAANPAQSCYTSVMSGTDGTGSPLSFNASACYNTTAATPAPPTNVSAVAH